MAKHLFAVAGLAAFSLMATPTPVAAQATFGSATLATLRNCYRVTSADVCDGTGPGQTRIVQSLYGGGEFVVGLTDFSRGRDRFARADVGFGAFDFPEIRAEASARGDVRIGINSFGFQSYRYSGPSGSPFSLTGDLHIIDSSTNPAGGALPGGAYAAARVGIWDPAILAGLTTVEDLFHSLFFASCGDPGVLGFGFAGGDLPGGEQIISATTEACTPTSLLLTTGQEVVAVGNIQLNTNREGWIDATSTLVTRFGDDLTSEQVANLEANMTSAIARGAGGAAARSSSLTSTTRP